MATVTPHATGALLREWRERRRVTQLELALEAGVSARHLSFGETGRSKPTSELTVELLFPADRATAELLENLPTTTTREGGAGP